MRRKKLLFLIVVLCVFLDKTDHQISCHRFWETTLYYYQSIKWSDYAGEGWSMLAFFPVGTKSRVLIGFTYFYSL